MKVKKTSARGAGKKLERIKFLIVARHGERLDKVFPTLLQERRYQKSDSNQPKDMPIIGRKFTAYRLDPPLTVFGGELMVNVRDSLEEARLVPVSAYCSPSLRCVQTGSKLAPRLALKIEPGLQENWPAGVDLNGKFLTPTEYHRAGFKVALGYQPIKDKIFVNTQNPTAFNERFGDTLDSIIKTEDKLHPGGTILSTEREKVTVTDLLARQSKMSGIWCGAAPPSLNHLVVIQSRTRQEWIRLGMSDANGWTSKWGEISAPGNDNYPAVTYSPLVGHYTTPDSVIAHLIDKRYGSFTGGDYTGHYVEEPKYGHVTVLKRSANGGWEVNENAVKPFSTSTFMTHNEMRAPEEEEEDDEDSRSSTDSD